MPNPSDKNKAPYHLLSTLQPHHRFVFFYGLLLLVSATIAPTLSGLAREQISLPEFPGFSVDYSHPLIIIPFISLLFISAIFFVLIGATYGKFLFRLLLTIIVGFFLLIFGSRVFVENFILLPVLFIISYVLWRGSHPLPDHPTVKDLLVIFLSILSIWGIVFAFGIRLPNTDRMMTLYMAITHLIVLASILPIPFICIAGIDLANMTDKIVTKITTFCRQKGNQAVLVTILCTSIVKLGVNLWKIEWNSINGLIGSVILIAFFLCLVIVTPKQLDKFKPLFKHWLVLTALIYPIPLGITLLFKMESILFFLQGIIGLIFLVLAVILFFFQKSRSFSILLAIIGMWNLLTISPLLLTLLFFDYRIGEFGGLNLWSLDLVSASIMIIWSIWLLLQRKSSPFASIALKLSLFLSGSQILYQLLNNKVAVAEVYTFSQVLTYLVIHQFLNRPKQAWWTQALPWFLVVILFIHQIWSGVFPEGVINTIKIGILTAALIWEIFTSEEKRSGAHQLGFLFIYLGIVTWSVAQVLFVKTVKSDGIVDLQAFEWEGLLTSIFLTIGIPWFLYLILIELKANLIESASTDPETTVTHST